MTAYETPLHVGESPDEWVAPKPAIQREPLVWQDTTGQYPQKYISEATYRKYCRSAQRNFKPVCQVCEAARFELTAPTIEDLTND